MSKHRKIVIKSCDGCPYKARLRNICTLDSDKPKIYYTYSIPEWCPLEKNE